MKTLAYINESGGVSIIYPARANMTMAEIAVAVPAGVTAQEIETDALPTERTFRDAWELKTKSVVVSLPKAKKITKGRLRAERKPLLEKLDNDYMMALEKGTSTTAIATEKQRLRDITVLPDSATTIKQLKDIKI